MLQMPPVEVEGVDKEAASTAASTATAEGTSSYWLVLLQEYLVNKARLDDGEHRGADDEETGLSMCAEVIWQVSLWPRYALPPSKPPTF